MDKPREVKVVLLGDSGVGKSSLVLRFVTNNFKPNSEATIGASFMSKIISVDGRQVKFQIWDTAGQEKYHSLAPMYYRGAAAAILVYDITRSHTFWTLQKWVDELKNQGPKDIAIAITGNKADLASGREVDQSMAKAYADTVGAIYLETSAKEDRLVQNVFIELSKRLPAPVSQPSGVIRNPSMPTNGNRQKTSSDAGCC